MFSCPQSAGENGDVLGSLDRLLLRYVGKGLRKNKSIEQQDCVNFTIPSLGSLFRII